MLANLPARNRTHPRIAESGAAPALFFVLFVAAAFLGVGIFAAYVQSQILSKWPAVEAEVTKSELHRMSSRNGPIYRAEWEFLYTANGRQYRTPLQSSTNNGSLDSRKAEAGRFPLGSRRTIRYDPSDPDAIEVNAGYTIGFFLLPLIFIAAGLSAGILVLWLIRRSSKDEPHTRCQSCQATIERSYHFCPQCAGKLSLRLRADARLARPSTSSSGTKAPLIVGAIFSIVGLIFLSFGVHRAVRQYQIVKTWKSVDAEVLQSEFVQTRGLHGLFHYSLNAQFLYTVDGRGQVSRATLNDSSSSGSNSYAFVRRITGGYTPGSHHTILVNPARPDELRFEAGPTIYFFTGAAALSAFGLIFSSVGFGILFASGRNKTRPCPSCHSEFAKGFRFCPNCGS